MKVITGRKIIVQDAQSNFTTTGFSNPFAKPSPVGNSSLQNSAGLTNPFINKGTTSPAGLINPWATAPTSYLQQSIDKKKDEEFKKSAEYAEIQKRVAERKQKIEQNSDNKDEKLLTDDEQKLLKKVGKTGLIISGVLIVGTVFFVFALVKAIKK